MKTGKNPEIQELKPLTIGPILDKSFKLAFYIIRKNLKFFLLMSVSLLIFIILIIAAVVAVEYYDYSFLEKITGLFDNPGSLFFAIPGAALVIIAVYTIFILYFGTIYSAMTASYLGRDYSIKSLFVGILKKFRVLFLSGLLCILLQISGLAMFVAGIIPVSVFISLAMPAIIFEDRGIISSISRSFKLVSYSFWNNMAYYLILFLINLSAYIILQMVSGSVSLLSFQNLAEPGITDYITMLAIAVAYLLIYCSYIFIMQMVNCAFVVVIFFNQKIKHENFGVELLTRSLVENEIPSNPED